jgi:hypothetical protein
VAGGLGGDEAAGWGSHAALKARFQACAADHNPDGGGELTKEAFKALVHALTEESDPDGTSRSSRRHSEMHSSLLRCTRLFRHRSSLGNARLRSRPKKISALPV